MWQPEPGILLLRGPAASDIPSRHGLALQRYRQKQAAKRELSEALRPALA